MNDFSRRVITSVVAAATAAITAIAADYKVSATIQGLADGTKIVMKPLSHEPERAIAETIVKDGKFTLEGSLSDLICARISVDGAYGAITLMLDSRDITIEATAGSSETGNGVVYSFRDVNIQGSPLTKELQEKLAAKDTLNAIRDAFSTRYKDIMERSNRAYVAKDSALLAQIKETEEYKAMMKEDGEFFQLVSHTYDSLFYETRDSYLGPILMIALTSYMTPDMRPTFEQMSDEAKQSYHGRKVRQELWPAGAVGQKAQPFSVKDEEGKELTLESLLSGKNYLLLDFWASWCGPCRREIPNIKNQYALYKDKGLEVVSISIDKNADAWRKAVEEEALEWPNFLSPDVADQYKVKAVPTMYLLDNEGKIVAENSDARGEKLAALLKSLLGD